MDNSNWSSRLVKNYDENKTYYLVKLSESFSNTIQEYSAAQQKKAKTSNNNNSHHNHHSNHNHNNHHHHNQNSHHHNNPSNALSIPLVNANASKNGTSNNNRDVPTIKFHGSRGAIKFPNGKCYDFSIEQSANTVECIRQTKNKWETVGRTTCCLHVKGKDDVYQRTRTKMEAAEQEKRKNCTKLLEENNASSAKTSSSSSSSTTTANSHHNNKSNKTPSSYNNNNHRPTFNLTSSNNSNNNNNNHNKSNKTTTSYNNHRSTISLTSSNNSNHNNNNNNNKSNKTTSSYNNNNHRPTFNLTSSNNNNNNISGSGNHSSNSHNHNLSKFPDITNVKQLKKYKAEFDKDYQEYQNLHGYLHTIEERFSELKESLKQSVEGSQGWESAKEQIFSEYERIKGDSNFHKARSKYKQLYSKLAHIKDKIFQFKLQNRDKFNHNNPIHINKRRKK